MFTAVVLTIRNRQRYNIFTNSYFRFIFTKYKFILYILGSLALILPVDFLEYHSWDYPIAVFQPILTYLTAPWATRVFYNSIHLKRAGSDLFVALCMMLFSGSWSVEIYLLIRDGYYMPDWLINIPIGIVFYIVAGLVWNTKWKEGKGHIDLSSGY